MTRVCLREVNHLSRERRAGADHVVCGVMVRRVAITLRAVPAGGHARMGAATPDVRGRGECRALCRPTDPDPKPKDPDRARLLRERERYHGAARQVEVRSAGR